MAMTLAAMFVVSTLSSGYLLLVSQPRLEHYTELARHARLLHAAMLDQETGLRGWFLTHDEEQLEPFVTGRARADREADAILGMAGAEPDVVRGAVDLMLARTAWESWADRARSLDRSGVEASRPEMAALLRTGKELFDAYRSADARATERIVAHRDGALVQQRASLLAVLTAYLAVTAVAGVRAARRKKRVARTLLAPIGDVLATIDALRAGDLTARSPRSGVVELDAVSTALEDLAHALTEAEELAAARDRRLTLLAARLETVVRVAREVSGSLSVRYVAEAVADAAAHLLSAPTTLWVIGDDGALRALRCSSDPHGQRPPPDLDPPDLVTRCAEDARAVADGTLRAYPIVLAGRVVGVLHLAGADADADTEHALQALLSTAAAALESARLHSAAQELADIDALTRLPNRRRLDADLQSEWDRSRRYGRPLSILMIDLDHFKQLNDTFGHLDGDAALRAVATAVQASLRASDTAYRYGGEELAVLLRETDLEAAALLAERIRSAIETVRIPGSGARATASIGLAERTSEMKFHVALLAAADAALFTAKRTGRNRVVVHSAPADGPVPAPGADGDVPSSIPGSRPGLVRAGGVPSAR